jgi:hypothetical protein
MISSSLSYHYYSHHHYHHNNHDSLAVESVGEEEYQDLEDKVYSTR